MESAKQFKDIKDIKQWFADLSGNTFKIMAKTSSKLRIKTPSSFRYCMHCLVSQRSMALYPINSCAHSAYSLFYSDLKRRFFLISKVLWLA